MNKLFITSLAIAAGGLLAVSSQVNAAGQCQVIYGGGEVCPPTINIELDKKVQRADTSELVDNLSENDTRFSAKSTVLFKVFVKNTSSSRISKIDVTDTLPNELKFVSGQGTVNGQKITYTISNLEPGATHENTIITQVVDEANLPNNKGVHCVENVAVAVAESKSPITDKARLCIQKQVLGEKVPVTTTKGGQPVPTVFPTSKAGVTPPTGPELFGLAALLPGGFAGYFLKRKKFGL